MKTQKGIIGLGALIFAFVGLLVVVAWIYFSNSSQYGESRLKYFRTKEKCEINDGLAYHGAPICYYVFGKGFIRTPATYVSSLNKQNEVDASDTSNWKTYRNEKYGFEF